VMRGDALSPAGIVAANLAVFWMVLQLVAF
jgi:hypothetical protein